MDYALQDQLIANALLTKGEMLKAQSNDPISRFIGKLAWMRAGLGRG